MQWQLLVNGTQAGHLEAQQSSVTVTYATGAHGHDRMKIHSQPQVLVQLAQHVFSQAFTDQSRNTTQYSISDQLLRPVQLAVQVRQCTIRQSFDTLHVSLSRPLSMRITAH